jgi:nucleotide-binding universal stress UspA family protein
MPRILLATEGRTLSSDVVDYAAKLAAGGDVHVFSVVRVWGTGLGLPNPGLLPNKREWEAQRANVADAVSRLRRRGVKADAHVLATRKATKRIVSEAARLHCEAIVMAADAPRNRLVGDLMWSQEPYRVRRRAKVPVHLVTEEP